jgi:NTP pyrophosphatase (non-canonical NTP hydrolase)
MPDLEEYASMTQKAAIYRDEVDDLVNEASPEAIAKMLKIFYATTGLAGEAGEVANKVKKILRDCRGVVSEETRTKLLGELGGVSWYLVALTEELGLKIEDVLEYNYDQIRSRQARGALMGDGDDR